jgi:hypothetical protein
MVRRPKLIAAYKILAGLVGLGAVATEIVVLINRGTFRSGNFFSFFTIEANLFAAIILIVSAVALLRGASSRLLTMLRGAATLYMITTGIVFSILLSGLDPGVLTAVPWDNIVLHYIMPVVLLLDWMADPPAQSISFRRALIWLVYPVGYVIYSLVRGSLVGWYPYPFLNPDTNGYVGIGLVSVGIAVVVLALTWAIVRGGDWLRRQAELVK